jgi:hypothetical protein
MYLWQSIGGRFYVFLNSREIFFHITNILHARYWDILFFCGLMPKTETEA